MLCSVASTPEPRNATSFRLGSMQRTAKVYFAKLMTALVGRGKMGIDTWKTMIWKVLTTKMMVALVPTTKNCTSLMKRRMSTYIDDILNRR